MAASGERSSWVKSAVKPDLALDPGLEGGRHVVEGDDERTQLGVRRYGKPGGEIAGGDARRRRADRGEGAHRPPGTGPSQPSGDDAWGDRRHGRRPCEQRKRVAHVVQREDLVPLGVHGSHRDADGETGTAVRTRRPLEAGMAVAHHLVRSRGTASAPPITVGYHSPW